MIKNIHIHKKWKSIFLISIIVLFSSTMAVFAQVRKEFTQRTSSQALQQYVKPGSQGKIYNLRGDFAMAGNTNLTFTNYSDNANNSSNLSYVDIDFDASTINSSSSYLNLLDDGCSEIVYAGLYWAGRANTGNRTFSATSTSASIASTATNQQFTHNSPSNNYYSMSINRGRSGGIFSYNYYPRYVFNFEGVVVQFEFTNATNEARVRYRYGNSGNFIDIENLGSYEALGDDNARFTFNTPFVVTVNGREYKINYLNRDSRNNLSQNEYRDSERNYAQVNLRTITSSSLTKTLDKRQIKFKKENQTYESFTASEDDIRYPNGTDANMYAAYVDVTEYVRTHGAGNYFVADIATTQGASDNTGYFGGWGLVVIYANPNMKWRDITVFDGYAYVAGSTTVSHQLPISGFTAAQSGDINVDIGVMAGEGDRSIDGDYFQVLARGGTPTNNNHYQNLGNSGGTGGFFNSNISTGSIKNPNLLNNTGIDIQRISLPNQTKVYNSQSGDKNFIIGNNQTSTTFKYGSTQDTYIIYNLVFAVDAYIPDVEVVNQVLTTSTSADIENLQPGDEVTYTLDIYNYGSDAIQDGNIDITIPQGLHLDSFSMVQNNTGEDFIETGATATFNFSQPEWINPTTDNTATPDLIDGGLLRWQLGDIPTQALVPNFEDRVPLATLTYTLKVTNNCLILLTSEEDCVLRPQINGEITGIGVNSGQPFTGTFVKAYDSDCNNTPIYGSIEMKISPSTEFLQNCSLNLPIVDETRIFRKFCSVNNNVIPRDEVTNVYPEGTVFYSNLPTSASPIVVNGDFYVNPNGTQTMYYAVLPNGNLACFYKLATILDVVNSAPTISNYQFCQGEEIVVSATPGTVGLDVFYFNSNTSGATPVGIPNSLPVGTHTYWVADGSNVNGDVCYGEKVAFTITIHPIPNEVLTNDIEICAGTSYTTSLNTPSGISALWQYQTTNSSTWVDLNNQLSGVSVESNELAIQNAQVELNQIKFRVIHTNSNGCTNTTDEFTLTVKACHMMINPMLSNPFKKP